MSKPTIILSRFFRSDRLCRPACALALLIVALIAPLSARAADVPVAMGSPLAGINFDDRPMVLPMQRHFQMAMLSVSGELGRTCGRMESYGWRLQASEQDRVNKIFDATVERLREQGFGIEAQMSKNVSNDVTIFTADRLDKRMLFMWSAGDVGLVLVLCDTTATPPQSLAATTKAPSRAGEVIQPMAPTGTAARKNPIADQVGKNALTEKRRVYRDFSPVGDWVGFYACHQGTTGATLSIKSVSGEQFSGEFRFYATPKNPMIPSGQYKVFGEYDRDSQKILINPGRWIQKPVNYYNTIIIGTFDPESMTFSGYFQGIEGCTSFEARYVPVVTEKVVVDPQKSFMESKSEPTKDVKEPKDQKKKKPAPKKKSAVSQDKGSAKDSVKVKKAADKADAAPVMPKIEDPVLPIQGSNAPAPAPTTDSPLLGQPTADGTAPAEPAADKPSAKKRTLFGIPLW